MKSIEINYDPFAKGYFIIPPKPFSYELQIDNKNYIIGIQGINCSANDTITGKLCLEEIVETSTQKWTPSLRHPFKKETKVEKNKKMIVSYAEINLHHDSFDSFAADINQTLKKEGKIKLNAEETNAFFRKAYDYYKENPGELGRIAFI